MKDKPALIGGRKAVRSEPGDMFTWPVITARLGESAKIEQYTETLAVAESINRCVFEVPWFKHYRPEIIAEHAAACIKVVKNHQALLAKDSGGDAEIGGYSSFFSTPNNSQ